MKNKQDAPIRKGLLFGFGRMGITHIALLNRYECEEIEWHIYEPQWKVRWIVKIFGSLAGLKCISEDEIKRNKYDYALICSPPQFHQSNYDLVKNISKKIFLEKPGFVTGVTDTNLYVGYVLRHAPCMSKLRSLIEGKDIAKVSIVIRSNTVTSSGVGWRASGKGGGVVNEFGSHAINLAKYIVKSEYEVKHVDSQKIVSLNCVDECKLTCETNDKANIKIDIDLNWSDNSVRKPNYKISVETVDGVSYVTDLYEIWSENTDGVRESLGGVANWNSDCKFYIRGLEFSEQTRYFVDNSEYSIDISDSEFTDRILGEVA